MELEKRRRFIINFLYFAILLGIAVVLCRYALGALMPFLIALLVSLLLRPVVRFLCERCRVQKGVAGAVVVLLFYALIGFLLIIIGIKLFAAAKLFFLQLPSVYQDRIAPWMSDLLDSIENFAAKLDPRSSTAYGVVSVNVTDTIGESVAALSKQVVSWVTSFTLKTPSFLLSLVITVIATVFLSIDLPNIRAFLLRQFSEKNRKLLGELRIHLGRTLGRYTRSYALILLITFGEIALGLLIIGVNNPVGTAAAIALFDILPVVGSGMILLPWTIIALLSGSYIRALGLGILYVIVVVVRNIIEPKIVGDRVGLRPIVTLMAMVVGTYLFGGIGLLGLPITLALLQSLNRQGVIHLYQTGESDSGAPADGNPRPPAPEEPSSPAGKEAPVKKAQRRKKP